MGSLRSLLVYNGSFLFDSPFAGRYATMYFSDKLDYIHYSRYEFPGTEPMENIGGYISKSSVIIERVLTRWIVCGGEGLP